MKEHFLHRGELPAVSYSQEGRDFLTGQRGSLSPAGGR